MIREVRDFDDLSQELRLSSASDRPLRYVAGLYYYQGDAKTVSRDQINTTTGAPTPMTRTRDEVENHAVFGSIEYDLAARWTAGVELRWAEDEVTVTATPAPGAPPSTAVLCNRTLCNDTTTSLTPRFSLTWRTTDDLTTYANIAKGTKPGDFNSTVPDESYRAVDEETLWSYELGLKARLLDDRLSLALAAYYLEVDDQQLTSLVELDTGRTESILVNAGETDAWGMEAELQAAVTDNFSLQASYAWTESEFEEYISPEEADLRGGDGSFADTQLLGDVSGNDSPRVPKHMASLAARYQRALTADRQWYAAGDWSFESSKYAAEHNLIETGDRRLVGLQTGLQQGRWDASLWVRNLLDDDTPVDIFRYFDGRYGSLPTFPQLGSAPASRTPRGFAIPLAPGRQAGITVRVKF